MVTKILLPAPKTPNNCFPTNLIEEMFSMALEVFTVQPALAEMTSLHSQLQYLWANLAHVKISDGENINCCPPVSTKIIDFEPPSSDSRLRVRPAAHLVDDAYAAKYSRAIELMKALPANDPRGFMQQANIHCAYCDRAYHQLGFPDLELQVHNSWLLFPIHRY
ncbi:hypothetical protein QUC31_017126 [Theobroma cacao]